MLNRFSHIRSAQGLERTISVPYIGSKLFPLIVTYVGDHIWSSDSKTITAGFPVKTTFLSYVTSLLAEEYVGNGYDFSGLLRLRGMIISHGYA